MAIPIMPKKYLTGINKEVHYFFITDFKSGVVCKKKGKKKSGFDRGN